MQNQANTQTIQNTVLNYRLTQINLSERTGKLVVKVNGKQKTFNVTLSALLVSYIEKGQFEGSFGKHVTSISFNSTLRDPEYKNNPFRLVKFEDDVYKLYLVTEAKPKKIEHPVLLLVRLSPSTRIDTLVRETSLDILMQLKRNNYVIYRSLFHNRIK